MAGIGGTIAAGATLVGQPEIAALAAGVEKFQQLAEAVADFVSKSNPGLFLQFSLAVDNLEAAFGKLFEPIITVFIPVLDMLNRVVTSIAPVFNDLFNSIKDGIAPLIELAEAMLKHFLLPITLLMKALTVLYTAFQPIREIFNSLIEIVATLYEAFDALAQVLFDAFFDPLKQILTDMKPIFDYVIKVIKTFAEVVKFLIESFVELMGGKIDRNQNKTIAAGKGSIVGIEDIGKQFRQAALDQMGNGGGEDKLKTQVPVDIAEIRKVLTEFFEYAKRVKQAVQQGGGIAANVAGNAALPGSGPLLQWGWNNLFGG